MELARSVYHWSWTLLNEGHQRNHLSNLLMAGHYPPPFMLVNERRISVVLGSSFHVDVSTHKKFSLVLVLLVGVSAIKI